MAFDAHANLAYTLVAIAPSPASSGTTLTVADGSVFPAAPFNATVWAIGEFPLLSNAEIVRVTSVIGNALVISRQAEGSPNRSIVVGDQIAAPLTVKTITDLETSIPSTAGLISAVNISAGILSQNLSALTFDNANGLSFGLTNGVITGTVATNYQSQGNYLTTAALSQDSSKYAGTNGAITGGSITVNTAGVSVNLPAYLTTAMASNRGSDFVAATAAFAGTNASGTIASNGISISVSAPGATASSWTVSDANTSATVGRLAFTNQNGVTLSLSTGANGSHTIVGSHNALTSQSTQYQAITLGGNTAGTTSFNATDNVSIFLHGGNNITLSGNGASITISGPNAAGAQTGISGIVVSDATYTSGTVSFSNAGNITIASSVNGATQYIKLSGNAAQTTQSAIKAFGVSDTGNTAGNTGVSTGIDWVLAASNSLSLSQSTTAGGPNTVWFQVGAYLTTAMASGASTQFVQANANFNGTNASGTIASNALSVSVAAPIPIATAVNAVASANSTGTVTRYAPEDHRHAGVGAVGISTSGNTAGTTGSEQGTYWFQGGNSITVSQITSNNGSHTLVISAGNYLTTAMASGASTQFVQANAGFNGTNASGTIASNSISVSVAAPIPIATAVNDVASANSTGTVTRYAPEDHRHAGIGAIGISTSGNTAGTTKSVQGTYWFQGGNSITVSQITSNNGSHTLVLSAGNYITTGALSGDTSKYVQVWELTGNTAGTTSSLQGTKIYFEGGNSITVSGNSNTIKLSVGAYLTTAMASNRGSDFVQATAGFNGTNASGTIASNSISVSVAAPIPIATTVNAVASANSTGTITRYAPEDHKHAGIGALGISTSGNTAGTTGSVQGTYWFQGGANLTVSQITSNNGSHTLVLSAGSAAAAPVNFSAGTTSGNLGSVVFSDSNGISWGLSGSTITGTVSTYSTVGTATTVYSVASANSVGTVTRWAAEDHRHAGVGGIGISTGNTSGTSGSVLGSYWIAGQNGITVSQITSNNGSHTLVLSGDGRTMQEYSPPWAFSAANTTFSLGNNTRYFQPFDVLNWVSGYRINFYVSANMSLSAGNSTGTCAWGVGYALYTRDMTNGANSNTLTLLTSYAATIVSASMTSNTAFRATHYIGLSNDSASHSTSQYAVSNASVTNYISTTLCGLRPIALPLNVLMSPGRYWLGFWISTTAGNAMTNNVSVLCTTVNPIPAMMPWGAASTATNASFYVQEMGWGSHSQVGSTWPNSIPYTSDTIRAGVSQTLINFKIAGYSTNASMA